MPIAILDFGICPMPPQHRLDATLLVALIEDFHNTSHDRSQPNAQQHRH